MTRARKYRPRVQSDPDPDKLYDEPPPAPPPSDCPLCGTPRPLGWCPECST